MKIAEDISQVIGGTPLIRLSRLSAALNLPCDLLGKAEGMNPAGSIKDRTALSMLDDAEKRGLLKKGGVVIEPTSGNTGIGLAALCAVRGYKLILTMPETMSEERRKLLKALGAQLVLTPGEQGMSGAKEKARLLHEEIKGSIIAGQFENPANPAAHYASTGPEIWQDTEGSADIFVAGVGTGGTLGGTVKYLKEKNPSLYAVAVEPSGSPVLSGGQAGPHGLQGIGAGFVPKILDVSLIDEIVKVNEEDAFAAGREIAKTDGVFAGISAGAAVHAAALLARRAENEGKVIVVVIPDTGARYLSTDLFRAD